MSVAVPPRATVVVPEMVDAGSGLTATAAVVTVVEPHAFVAVKVYTPAEAVLTVKLAGDKAVEEKLLGPLQE